MHKGKPLPGVGVGYVTVNRSLGGGRPENRTHYIDREEIATDDEGRFLFSNVNADDDLYVYGLMKTLKTYGAVPIHKVKTGSDGTTTDVGDLFVQVYEKGTPPSIQPAFSDPEFRKKNSEFEARRRQLIAGIPDDGAR